MIRSVNKERRESMEGDLSAIVYVVILAILLSKVFGFGCGGGTCS